MRLSHLAHFLIFLTSLTQAQNCHEFGSEVHGTPSIGIMNGHVHSKGHWMASYRFMTMNMNGISSQGHDMTSHEVLNQYMMAPTTMQMNMHMLGGMYAPIDRLTLGIMASYNSSSMIMESSASHNMAMGGTHDHGSGMHEMNSDPISLTTSKMRNEGFGDLRISGLYRILVDPVHCLHSIVGISVPTGTIDAGDAMHPILPYTMQNGIGSVSGYVGINYSWLLPQYVIGAQVISTAPLHENKRGYMAPMRYEMNVWGGRKLTDWISINLRVRGFHQTAIRGADVLIDDTMSPLGNSSNLEHWSVEAMGGVNFIPFEQGRIAVEAGIPAYQWNTGVSMNKSWSLTVGLQFIMH